MKRHFIVEQFETIEIITLKNRVLYHFENSKYLLKSISLSLKTTSQEDFIAISTKIYKALFKFIENNNILLSIIPQSPLGIYSAAMELEFLESNFFISINSYLSKDNLLQIQEVDTPHYCELNSFLNSQKYETLSQMGMKELLDKQVKLHTKNNVIVRLWNFIGNITKFSIENQNAIQNYQKFNNARYEVFEQLGMNKYPASTGIGMDFLNLISILTSVTISSNKKIYYLENENQKEAYNYSEKVLLGDIGNKKAPLFSRGLLLDDGETLQLFISGTSSIIGESSIAPENLEEATLSTIENINRVCDAKILSEKIGKEINQTSIDFKFVRVYLKNGKCTSDVEQIIKLNFRNAAINFVSADICREELLIEIEAYGEITA